MPRFRHVPVLSLMDATANFEQLEVEAATTAVSATQLANALAALTSGWVELTLGPKIKAVAVFQTPRVRTEQSAAVARLRGVVAPKAAEELKAGETLATLPVGYRPTTNVLLSLSTKSEANAMTIAATGVMTLALAVTAEQNIPLDGLTFNLT